MSEWELNRLLGILGKPVAEMTVAELLFMVATMDKVEDADEATRKQVADLIGIDVAQLGDALL